MCDRWPARHPAYMAPEAWAGAATVDAKADVYAPGMIFFSRRSPVSCPSTTRETTSGAGKNCTRPRLPRAPHALILDAGGPTGCAGGADAGKAPRSRPDMAEVAAGLISSSGRTRAPSAGGFVRDGEFYVRRDADDTLFYAPLNGQHLRLCAPPERQDQPAACREPPPDPCARSSTERGLLRANLDLRSVEASGTSSLKASWCELYRRSACLAWPPTSGPIKRGRCPRRATTPVEALHLSVCCACCRYVGQPVVVLPITSR